MFPPTTDFINIDVVYLNYNPERNPAYPSIEYEGNHLAGLPDLHTHYTQIRKNRNFMSKQSYKHTMWYNSILQEELDQAPSGYKLQVFHWKFESGISDVFRIKDFQFNEVTMIIGPTTEYWYGINTSRSNGFRKRGRYPRQFPKRPKIPDICSSLPQCHIITSSCNLTITNLCRCFAKSFLSGGKCITTLGSEFNFKTLYELIGIYLQQQHARQDDDTDDDGDMQDILLFRICMTKYSRNDALKIMKMKSNHCKLNILSNTHRRLSSIAESEDETL